MTLAPSPSDLTARADIDAAAAAPAIRIADLTFAWGEAGPDVLDIPELTIARGEHVFVHGPSGSGKSTLLNLVAGVTRARWGRLEVLGTDLTGLGQAARDHLRADHIGLVFQMFNLVPYLSMVENVTLPCLFSRRRRSQAQARGGIETEAARLLGRLGLDAGRFGHRPVTQLSVGQQQRVAAARALIGAPEIVIADEPTSALDSDARDAFLALLLAEARAATVLFVSHDRALAHHFSRTISLAEINRDAP